MNEIVEAVAALLREGIVIEQTKEGAVRIRLEDTKADEGTVEPQGERLSW